MSWEIWDDLNGPTDPELEEKIARWFYHLEGWERYWPYEKRPEWLKERYP